MKQWKQRLTTYTEHTSKRVTHKWKKAAAIVMIGGCLAWSGSTSVLAEAEESDLYYVYIGDQYMGTVDNPQVIENIVEDELENQGKSYEGIQKALDHELSYLPEDEEKAFNEATDKELTSENALRGISIKADAFALEIDGETVAYVKNQEEANEVLQQLQLQYISEKDYKELKERSEEEEPLPELAIGDTRLLNAKFSEEIEWKKEKVDPNKMQSVDEVINFLNKGTVEQEKYRVEEGDSISTIADEYHLSTEELEDLNDIGQEDVLKVGQELVVETIEPYVDVITNRSAYKEEDIPFHTKVIEDDDMLKGEEKVKQEGKKGKRNVLYHMKESNGEEVDKSELKEEIIDEPVEEIIIKGTKNPDVGDGDFAWPAVGGYVSSELGHRWGKLHKGIDIARPSDRTIKAADNGKVISAGFSSSYGYKVEIDHQNGYRTLYAHLDSLSVSAGETVTKGSKLGVMGSTGNSTGVHLHFELYKDGQLKNPLDYISQ